MTIPEGDGDPTSEAAYWLVALEEEPENAELRARFEAWRAARPENAEAWSSTGDVYDLIGSPQYVAHRAARSAGSNVVPLRRRAKRRFRALAALAVAACVAFAAAPALMLRWQADYLTATAESRAVTLPDGSTATLAPGSALDVQYAEGERSVRLLKGEALFEVQPNPQRPFVVKANGVETTVLGTVFDVRLLEEGALVSVRDGQVRVDDPATSASQRLASGDWVRMDRRSAVRRGEIAPSDVAAWRGGRIVAQDLAIGDIVEELRRSYDGAIVLASDSLGRERVTGVYDLGDPVAALRAAAGVHGGRVHRLSPWLIVVTGQ